MDQPGAAVLQPGKLQIMAVVLSALVLAAWGCGRPARTPLQTGESMTEEKPETFTLKVGQRVVVRTLELELMDIIPSWQPAPPPEMRKTSHLATLRVTSGQQAQELTMAEGVSDAAFGLLFTFDKVTEDGLTVTVGPNGTKLAPAEWETVGPINLGESASFGELTITLEDTKEMRFEAGVYYAADLVVASGGEKASLRVSPLQDAQAFGHIIHVLAIDEGYVTLGLKEESEP